MFINKIHPLKFKKEKDSKVMIVYINKVLKHINLEMIVYKTYLKNKILSINKKLIYKISHI